MTTRYEISFGVGDPVRCADAGQAGVLARWRTTLLLWQHRGVSRRHLAALDDALLRDLGITRGEAMAEAAKPFWRA